MKGIIANRRNFGSQRVKDDIKYIVIHYTSNKNDTAEGNCKYFQRDLKAEGKNVASAHYFVDDKEIVQSVYDNYVAYSVGGAKWNNGGGRLYGVAKNANTLNIELCGNSERRASDKTIERALSLTRAKMREYNIPKERVIRHYDVNGKLCPLYWVDDLTWREEFWGRLDEPTYKTGKYKMVTDSYVRSYPFAANAYKMKYDNLPLTVKSKCKKDPSGYALFRQDKTFSLAHEVKDMKGNIWGKTKSGFYLPMKYNNKERAY